MKPLFDEQTAREIGYQKYWPEPMDWVVAVVGTLAITVPVGAILYLILS